MLGRAYVVNPPFGCVYMTMFSLKKNGTVSYQIGCLFTHILWNSMQIPSESDKLLYLITKLDTLKMDT